ncbi:MAG: DUF2007 domain-containing protein [bacterium]|nr:DUF2007 domain-containing protein [bacterium]
MNETTQTGDEEKRLVIVYRAPDEQTALTVKSFLEAEGIEVLVTAQQVPWYDGVLAMGQGYWGDVSVIEDDVERAAQVIKDNFE